ncbi:MAG: Rieske 2Fe-2S domain-containing protein [Acidimicrobiales bacterium]
MIRNTWYAVGLSGELVTARLSGMTVAGRPMVAWRDRDGGVHVLDGRCAHKRFPLAKGRLLDDGSLECAYHGFRYDGCGRCVGIPALEGTAARFDRMGGVRAYPAVDQDGVVWVWPGDDVPVGGPPATPEIGGAGWDAEVWGPCTVRAAARLLVENLFDLTHFYPLHAGNIGTYADASVAVETERSPDGNPPLLGTTRRRERFRFGQMKADWFGVEVGDNIATHQMVVPGLFRVVERVAPPEELGTDAERRFVLYHTITPVDETSLVWRRVVCSPREPGGALPDRSLAARVTADCVQVAEEDRWALEAQQEMFAYPDDGFAEVHIKSDAPVLAARRLLDDFESTEQVATAGMR